MSYPLSVVSAARHRDKIRELEAETLMVIHQRDNLRVEREAWMRKALEECAEAGALRAEVREWRSNHASVVGQKRKLGAKYAAIMRNKPKARWRRTKKRVTRGCRKFFGYGS